MFSDRAVKKLKWHRRIVKLLGIAPEFIFLGEPFFFDPDSSVGPAGCGAIWALAGKEVRLPGRKIWRSVAGHPARLPEPWNDGFNHNRSGFGRLPNGFETEKYHETGSEDHQFDTRNQCNLPCNFVQEGSQHGETTTSLALRFHFSRSSRDGERSKARDSNDFFNA